jgi:hypothetical protein
VTISWSFSETLFFGNFLVTSLLFLAISWSLGDFFLAISRSLGDFFSLSFFAYCSQQISCPLHLNIHFIFGRLKRVHLLSTFLL